ncbi:MAG: polysaccharide biosynthesis/export family protein [Kovacikia sp.]
MRMTGLLCSSALTVALTLELIAYSDIAHAQTAAVQPVENQAAVSLKPGDRIRITVIGFQELSGEQMVLSDGAIELPLAGRIGVGKLTPNQAVARITEALLPYIRRPQVGLSVVSISPIRINVAGEVMRPGPRLLTPPSPINFADNNTNSGNLRDSNTIRLSDALVLAGGIKPNADIRNIIVRRVPDSTPADKSKRPITEIKVDLWQAVQNGNLAADLPILDGDEIVVPTAQISSADQQILLASTVAPTKIVVQVGGQVQRPGRVEIEPTAGASDAVGAAGGLTDKADREIELIRMTPEGRLVKKKLAFGDPSGPLMNGDLIVVNKSTGSKITDLLSSVFGSVISPLIFLLK